MKSSARLMPLLTILFLVWLVHPALADKRVALVIGNGAYDGVGDKDMVTRFSRVRFDPKRLAILPKDLRFA